MDWRNKIKYLIRIPDLQEIHYPENFSFISQIVRKMNFFALNIQQYSSKQQTVRNDLKK